MTFLFVILWLISGVIGVAWFRYNQDKRFPRLVSWTDNWLYMFAITGPGALIASVVDHYNHRHEIW